MRPIIAHIQIESKIPPILIIQATPLKKKPLDGLHLRLLLRCNRTLRLDLLLDCHIGKSKKQPGIVNSESKNWVLEEVLEGGALWLGLALGVRRTHGGRVTFA